MGGGNSAGQAVVFLARKAAKIWHLVRGPSLSATMSSYLVERISGLANVEVLTGTEVSGLEGSNGLLEAVRWRRVGSDEEVRRPVRHLFLFIGADPNTDWLDGSGVMLDPSGFVLAGADVGADRRPLETSRLGVFAIGDARSGSIKRVAAAVGRRRTSGLGAPCLPGGAARRARRSGFPGRRAADEPGASPAVAMSACARTKPADATARSARVFAWRLLRSRRRGRGDERERRS